MKKGRIRNGSPFEIDWIGRKERRRARPGGSPEVRDCGGLPRRTNLRDTLVSVLRDAASRKSAVAGYGKAIAPSNRPTKIILSSLMNG